MVRNGSQRHAQSRVFWGGYKRLLGIKKQYDPSQAICVTVGSVLGGGESKSEFVFFCLGEN